MRHSIRSQIFTGDHHNLLVVGTEGDDGQPAEDVQRIHDEKLAKLGTDSLTRCAIDTYRKQCFGTADPLIPGSTPAKAPAPASPLPERMPAPAAAQTPAVSAPKAPTAADQAAAAVAQVFKPPADAGDIARQQHADKLKADLERLQADHDARVTRRAGTAPPEPEASAPAGGPTAPPIPKPAPADGVCEKCGAPVTKSQEKLSKLFLSKTLCKKCMEAP